jgi:hypothetical protein
MSSEALAMLSNTLMWQHRFFLGVMLICGGEAALCLWQMSSFSVPFYCHPAAISTFSLVVC